MANIQPLPDDVVHLIAAGEVIDSLAAVVRELAENALDAGATRITLSIWPEQWRVRVVDNGCGMPLADLKQAATAHSTSKIRQSADLWHIRSLGFRGEALHSLAQLADLEIGSRWAESVDGWWIQYDRQGRPRSVEVAAIAPGTVVTVSDLFGNWQPRRQGLPSVNQQLRAVQTVIQQMALCHPQVTWQVYQGDAQADALREREWFAIWAGQTARHIVPQLLREVQPSDLREVTFEIQPPQTGELDAEALPEPIAITPSATPSLYLLIGLPDRCHRHRPDWVRVAVNGRAVKAPELEHTLMNGFRRTLPRDRHPVCLLHLHLSPDQIDWNRHPAKAEIYLRHLPFWREQVDRALDQALRLNASVLAESAHSERVGHLLKTAEAEGAYKTSRRIEPASLGEDSIPSDAQDDPDHGVTPLLHPTPSALKALAQVHQRYILAEHPTGLCLVEQHIAHERVLYEQLCDRWQLIPVDPPLILRQLVPAQVEQLQRLGLSIEPFGDQLWAVRTLPEALSHRDDCAEALIELSLGGDLDTAIVATACRTAIRNGVLLSLPEMQTLLDRWQQTRNPRTCPHGRPICLTLEESSLSRYFRRHWVIGKSHGI